MSIKREDIHQFYRSLVRMARRQVPIQVWPAQVQSLDYDASSIVIKEEDSDVTENVRLKSSIDNKEFGVVLFPKKGSWVLVGRIANDENNLYVAKINELDRALISIEGKFKCLLNSDGQLTLNDGKYDGLVIIKQLSSNLDALKSYIGAIADAVVPIATVAETLTPTTLLNYNTAKTVAELACQFQPMENKKIKH